MPAKPLLLIILDGFGYREAKDNNAIASANTPCWNKLWAQCPHALLSCSGHDVGLPDEQMGNSEVGHMHIGAGRLLPQMLTLIDEDIKSGGFFHNAVLTSALEKLNKNKALHIMALISTGGVHSHENHIFAMLECAAKQGIEKIYVHAFLDGRDTPPRSARSSLQKLQAKIDKLGAGQIASIIGRYYAMDRDKRWNRIEKAYRLVTEGIGEFQAKDAISALDDAYARGENDEFVKPVSVHTTKMQGGDIVVFMNFRADRARQLTRALTDINFDYFQRHYFPKLAEFVTLTEYASDINAKVAYPALSLPNIFGEYIAKHGLKQLRIAETEKYAHVTFFFNGGIEQPFDNEDRILVPSPKVTTYDLQPEMSAIEVTDRLVEAILHDDYDCIICNFANPDMVGHSGNFDATIKAIAIIDKCLQRIIHALHEKNGECLITADHGNAEYMYNPKTKQPHTAHTTNLVPLVYVGRHAKFIEKKGKLLDIAPTMLYLLGLEKPQEMTGKNLLKVF